MVRVYMTKALVDGGTPSIDAVIQKWGGVDDKGSKWQTVLVESPLQSLTGCQSTRFPDSITDKRRHHVAENFRELGYGIATRGSSYTAENVHRYYKL